MFEDRAQFEALMKAWGDLNANAQSMAKHAAIAQGFSVAFLVMLALLNTVGFGAFTLFLSSTVGQTALHENYGNCLTALVGYIVGFVGATATMSLVFQFSLDKFDHYRALLKSHQAIPVRRLVISSGLFLGVAVAGTAAGVGFTSALLLYTK